MFCQTLAAGIERPDNVGSHISRQALSAGKQMVDSFAFGPSTTTMITFVRD